jgi:hypothetical protein
MQRRTVAIVVLTGIWVAGGLGGRLMSQSGRVRPRPAVARRAAVGGPLRLVSVACPVVSSRPEVGCDTLVRSGD